MLARPNDLLTIEREQRICAQWFFWAQMTIIVSSLLHIWTFFRHFNPKGIVGTISTGALTGMLDIALISLIRYMAFMRRQKKEPHPAFRWMLYVVLFNAGLMNAFSIYMHRPDENLLPAWASALFAIVMGFSTSALVAIFSLPVTSEALPVRKKNTKRTATGKRRKATRDRQKPATPRKPAAPRPTRPMPGTAPRPQPLPGI